MNKENLIKFMEDNKKSFIELTKKFDNEEMLYRFLNEKSGDYEIDVERIIYEMDDIYNRVVGDYYEEEFEEKEFCEGIDKTINDTKELINYQEEKGIVISCDEINNFTIYAMVCAYIVTY